MTDTLDDTAAHLQVEQIDGLIAAAGVDGTREIMDAFWRSTSDLLNKLATELATPSLADAAKTAHAIKGSAANVGAARLSQRAAAMEASCKNGAGEETNGLLSDLSGDFETARQHFEAHLQAAAA